MEVKDFIGFLKENDALEAYQDSTIDWYQYVARSIMARKDDELLCAAFSWWDSLEGHKYWEDLDIKWKERCNG